MNTRFSIIVPVYNGEHFIDPLLRNLLSSDYENYEIILIDDGSTDQSLRLMQEYADKENRVKVFHQKNRGIWAARNAGIEYSTGDYILFSDQDDTLFISVLASLNEDIEAHGFPDVVCAQAEWVDGNTLERRGIGNYLTGEAVNRTITREEIVGHLFLPMIGELKPYALPSYFSETNSVWHCAYKKRFLSENGISFIQGTGFDDDYFFKAAVFSRAQTAYLSDRVLYRWYIRGASRSHTAEYIEDYYDKADSVCQYEMNELIRYIVENGFLTLSENEINQISCDKYWWRIKEAVKNECSSANPHSLHEKVNNLKKPDLKKTNRQSIKKDKFYNQVIYFILTIRAYYPLLIYGKIRPERK